MRSLSPDEKALRRARLDDWCARHRVETAPPPPQSLEPDALAEMALMKLPSNFWGSRKVVRNRPKGKDSAHLRHPRRG